MIFFFDSYAIIELIKGSPTHIRFQNTTIITTILNIAEVYYYLLKDAGKNKAEIIMHTLNPDLVEFDVELIKEAMEFRRANIKKKMSMVDCIGYVTAQKLHAKLLTGDDALKDFPNVEFVK